MIDLNCDIINEQLDVLMKNYWLFVYGKIRAGVWDDLFRSHLDKYYPTHPELIDVHLDDLTHIERGKYYKLDTTLVSGNFRALTTMDFDPSLDWSKTAGDGLMLNGKTCFKEISSIRNSRRTNFPRTIWSKKEISWLSYYEGAIVLSQIYKEMYIDFELVYHGTEIHRFSLPVKWDLFETQEGETIFHKGRVTNELVVPSDFDRSNEQGLSYIIREIMRKSNLTRIQLDALLDVYASDPENLNTFTTNSKPNIKSSIIGTMLKWNLTWDNYTRALKVLGYTDLSLTLRAVKETPTRTIDLKASVSMGLA